MDATLVKLLIEGGAGLVALYLLAGVKAELGHLRGILETIARKGWDDDKG